MQDPSVHRPSRRFSARYTGCRILFYLFSYLSYIKDALFFFELPFTIVKALITMDILNLLNITDLSWLWRRFTGGISRLLHRSGIHSPSSALHTC
ncbi:hypothetical protein B0T26DRAFT_46479 [Lasiosphaeria miniovina]|uniref:Uncharacterized protein n=1 Tax=Lasiosphaeria miniovina TaxID=1954250 RepID=A0AA40BGS7_9PEZI|nr:uncharacterized protein B0T26DRAFT_46479 [Lasiosphaeria miniovina]KAK0733965.1 hypothetical protein B0T26DRAFT_46479 [Lasiosphaeria miniovina]